MSTLTIERSTWTADILEDGSRHVPLTEFSISESGEKIARLAFRTETGEIEHLWTRADRRRQGHASRLFEAASAEGAVHSAWRTEDGQAWALAVGGYLPRRRHA